jgi:hypothetical protein
MLRYRLIDQESTELGTFASVPEAWEPGDRLMVRPERVLEIVSIVPAGETDEFDAYIVVKQAQTP